MTKQVRFNGRPHAGPTDTLATPPLVGIWSVGDVVTFDARLARELGRSCGEDCKGDCWAEFFVATWNINADHNAPWFEIVSARAAADAPSPASPVTVAVTPDSTPAPKGTTKKAS